MAINMGHSWVEVEISDLEKKKSTVVKALVDTGASLTVLPKKLADELGIAATSEEKVTTGAGEIKVKGADVWIKIRGREKTNPVWISDIIDKVLIGVVTLESLGFAVDPKTGTLREEPLLLYTTFLPLWGSAPRPRKPCKGLVKTLTKKPIFGLDTFIFFF
ncbi:MAG: aspartyl protease family protein [Euryarchaeota archaeon]|nr:aspartyl protease family protein [Euryarchaeota archaeon]